MGQPRVIVVSRQTYSISIKMIQGQSAPKGAEVKELKCT